MGERNVKYYLRKSGVYVRVVDDVNLEYLTSGCEWLPNQEWFLSMFIDGEDEFIEVPKEIVDNYIKEQLNSKKMTR
jgi:hypothetical protein